jgi:RND family efflux transporter MFP subunit
MNGVVDRVHVEPGQFMDVGNPVAKILDIDRVKVEVGIPESDVDAVRRLDRFTVIVEALGGKTFEGARHYLQKTSDDFARLYNLEIAVANPQAEILPDMFTRVVIVKSEVPEALAVPLYALIKRNEMDAVFVIDDGVARLRPVTLGIQDGWHMQVRKGIAAGDQVVVVGQRTIEDGEALHVSRAVRSMEELIP